MAVPKDSISEEEFNDPFNKKHMRTREELEIARRPRVKMIKAAYSQASSNPAENFSEGDLIPFKDPGEAIYEQMLEVMLDIRDLLQDLSNKKEV